MKIKTRQLIVAKIKTEIAARTKDNPELTLAENSATVKDLIEHVSDKARAKERLNDADWSAWCGWFQLSANEQSAMVNAAR